MFERGVKPKHLLWLHILAIHGFPGFTYQQKPPCQNLLAAAYRSPRLNPPHAVYLENSLSRLSLSRFLALSLSLSHTHTYLGRSLSLSLFHTHWVDDEEALPVAANTIKTYAMSALVREEIGFLASHRAAVHMEAEQARQLEELSKKEQEDESERRRESKRLEEEALARRRAEEEERREHQVPQSLHEITKTRNVSG